MSWVRCSGGASKYSSVGLTPHNSRCIIEDGGYYVDANDVVHIDITIRTTTSVGTNNIIVNGFPVPATKPTTAPFYITSVHNNLVGYYRESEDPYWACLDTATAIAANTQIRFVGSYQS